MEIEEMTDAQLEHNLKVMLKYKCPLAVGGWMYSVDDVRRELKERRDHGLRGD